MFCDHFQALEIVVFEFESRLNIGDPDDGGIAALFALFFVGERVGAKFDIFGGASIAATSFEWRHFGLLCNVRIYDAAWKPSKRVHFPYAS